MRKKVLKNKSLFIAFLLLALIACKEEDTVKPLISIKGDDTIRIVLNSEFNDPGITATDDTDGDLSQNVAISTDLDVNKVDLYEIYYTVSDKAGNVSETAMRYAEVYNEAEDYADSVWKGYDTTLYDGKIRADEFDVYINIDSTINNNIIFSSLSKEKVGKVYGQIEKNGIELPEQKITYNDSLKITCQGRGKISEKTINLYYTYYTDTTAEFKYVRIIRE